MKAGWTICLQLKLDGAEVSHILSDGSDGTSTSDGSSADSSESGLNLVDNSKILKEKLKS